MATLKKPKWLQEAKNLIHSITGLEDGNVNFDICLQYVSSNFNHHQFMEIDEKQVDNAYQRLVEKLVIHSELGKASRLKSLLKVINDSTNNFQSKKANEILSSLLLIFLRLSGSSDTSKLPENQLFQLTPDDTEDFDWIKYLRDDDDEEEDEMVLSQYIDELSDWSADETDEDPSLLHVKIVPPKRDDSGIDISADVKSVTHSLSTNATTPSPMQMYPPAKVTFEVGTPLSDRANPKELIWLQKHIMNSYWKGSPSNIKRSNCLSSNLNFEWEKYLRECGVLSVNESGSYLTERQVIREVLWMLQGNENLFLFKYDLGSRSFYVTKDVCVSHLTPNAMLFLLDSVCKYGNSMKILKYFVDQTMYQYRNSCQTVEAYVSGLQMYLNKLRSKISKFEKIIINQEETCSLNEVINELGPSLDILTEVYEVHKEGIESVQADATNRVKSACLLSALHRQLSSCDLLQTESTVFSLFLITLQPYLTIIDKFIYKGNIEDPFDEFFLTRNSVVNVNDEDFWKNAYTNHVSEKSGCTDFLKFFVKEILVAGKSVEMLNMLEKQCSVNLSDNGFDIYGRFVNNIKKILQPPLNNNNSFNKSGNFELSENSESFNEPERNPDQKINMSNLDLWDPYLIENFCRHTTLLSTADRKEATPELHQDIWSIQTSFHKPLPLTIHNAIAPLISKNCEEVSKNLIDVLKTDCHLMSVLKSVRRFYFMEAGDVMFTFYSAIFNKMQMGEDWKNSFSLNALLCDAISCQYPSDVSKISIHFEEQKSAKKVSSISALSNLRLSYVVPWPVDAIITKNSFKIYNTIFCFLLQIKQAKYCLDQLRFCDLFDEPFRPEDQQKMVISMLMKGKIMKEYKTPKEQVSHVMHLFRMRLMHFVNCLHDYIMIRILQTTDYEIQKALESAKNLEEVMDVHKKYLDNINKRCLCHPDFSILKESIIKVLNLVLSFQDKWLSELSTLRFDDLQRMEKLFLNCYQFLMNFFSRMVKQGSFPHLESLVICLEASKMPVLFDALAT